MRTVLSDLVRRLRRSRAPFRLGHAAADKRFAWRTTASAQPAANPLKATDSDVAIPDPNNWAWSAAQPADLGFANEALSRVILNYAPVLDRRHAVMGTRLTVHALGPMETARIEELLQAISQVWPEEAGHRVSLNMVSHALARALLRLRPARNILIEVPALLAVERDSLQHIKALQANGNLLQIKDCAACNVPADLLRHFQYLMAGLSEPVRLLTPSNGVRPDIVRSDIRSLNGMRAAFANGAIAATGWPMATPLQAARLHALRTNSRAHIVVELLRLVNQGAPADRIERTVSQDPTVAYKLLRYANSAAFNLPVKVVAIRDAVAVLGRQKLKRWLALMLAASGPHADLRPTTFAAMRRGVLMEELARLAGHEDWGDELFICGIFSLIDRMLGQPMRDLLAAISVPGTIAQTLVVHSGPYVPYLRLARAVENGPFHLVRQTAEELGLGMDAVNRTLLRATAAAVELGQY